MRNEVRFGNLDLTSALDILTPNLNCNSLSLIHVFKNC